MDNGEGQIPPEVMLSISSSSLELNGETLGLTRLVVCTMGFTQPRLVLTTLTVNTHMPNHPYVLRSAGVALRKALLSLMPPLCEDDG